MENIPDLQSLNEDLMELKAVDAEDIEIGLPEIEDEQANGEAAEEKESPDEEDGEEDPREMIAAYKKDAKDEKGAMDVYTKGRFSGYRREEKLILKPSIGNLAFYSGSKSSQVSFANEVYSAKSLQASREISRNAPNMSPVSYSSASAQKMSSIVQSANMATDYSSGKGGKSSSTSLLSSSSSGKSVGYCCACAANALQKMSSK
jgi:hypothetical protein